MAVSGSHKTFNVLSVSYSRAVFALYRGNGRALVVLVVIGGIISDFNNLQIILHMLSLLHTLYDAKLTSASFTLVNEEQRKTCMPNMKVQNKTINQPHHSYTNNERHLT